MLNQEIEGLSLWTELPHHVSRKIEGEGYYVNRGRFKTRTSTNVPFHLSGCTLQVILPFSGTEFKNSDTTDLNGRDGYF